MSSPPYTRAVFSCNQRKKVVNWLVKHVVDLRAQAIVVCGQSGIIPGAVVSHLTDVPLVVVRKPGEPSNSGNSVHYESPEVAERWVIIDDLIASGDTVVNAMTMARKGWAVASVRPSAILLYHEDMSYPLFSCQEGRKTFTPGRYHWDHMTQKYGCGNLWPIGSLVSPTPDVTLEEEQSKLVNALMDHTQAIEVRYTWAD